MVMDRSLDGAKAQMPRTEQSTLPITESERVQPFDSPLRQFTIGGTACTVGSTPSGPRSYNLLPGQLPMNTRFPDTAFGLRASVATFQIIGTR